MSRTPLVIGYGNPLRADDGFGWEAAQQLASRLPADAATVLAVHQLTPELADEVGRASLVVFVDAHAGGTVGQLVVRSLAPDADEPGTFQTGGFSHDVDAEGVLALARALFGACSPAVMLSVGGDDFGYGVRLSAAVSAMLPEVLAQITAILATNGLDSAVLEDERTRSCMR